MDVMAPLEIWLLDFGLYHIGNNQFAACVCATGDG
jgi:hypothetical protein